MTVQPLGARVLVRPLEQQDTTPGGIIVPDVAREKPQQGLVEAVGQEDVMTTNLKVGDRVLFAKYSGNDIRVNGDDLLLMDEVDILARIKD